MPELLGIIAPLRKFLSNSDETIGVEIDGNSKDILALTENRQYIIPDFQREIRWDKDNLAQLIDDIRSGPKYLGNVILTQKRDQNTFLIIDGQQRITVLTMLLSCLNRIHGGQMDTIIPCKLIIESFLGFAEVLGSHFPDQSLLQATVIESDKLHQISSYYVIWDKLLETDCIINRKDAKAFLDNLGKSTFNVIINRSDDAKDGIRYFIDVNLKGKQLDIEDIFKAHLFRNDSSAAIRNEWYKFKSNSVLISASKIHYPLLKLLEHYFYCDLYNDPKFKGLDFGEDFLLNSEFKTHEEPPVKHRSKTHLIEVIDSNEYMLESLRKLNRIIEIMLNIASGASPNIAFKSMFPNSRGTCALDDSELTVIHNFMNKILRDVKVLPKALIMKYILSTLLDPVARSKDEYRKIYGAYLLSVLFVIFENKKSINVFVGVLKSVNDEWYTQVIAQIRSYFDTSRITDSKLLSPYKLCLDPDGEDKDDYQFRCKSLATIYNYLRIRNNKVVVCGSMSDVKKFVSDDESFSTEHLIISHNASMEMIVRVDEQEASYKHLEEIYKRYVKTIFNFIFVSRDMNTSLSNYWLPQKLEVLSTNVPECQYSQMIISKLDNLRNAMQNNVSIVNCAGILDSFFSREFKELYINYARSVLNSVIDTVKA